MRTVLKAAYAMAMAAYVVACADSSIPTVPEVAGTGPDPEMAPMTWYTCGSFDGGYSWNCVEGGTDWFYMPDATTWDFTTGGNQITHSVVNCEFDPDSCSGGGSHDGDFGPLNYDPYRSQEFVPCDPQQDPACERTLTRENRTLIVNAINYWKRRLTDIADPDARYICQTTIDVTISLLNDTSSNTVMFEGAYDTPQVSGKDHYGAWDPVSHHIHFDPGHFANLETLSSNDAYQVANTALHEVLHNMGYDHPHGSTIMNYHGKTPLYTDWPFTQLNPRAAESCMK